MRQKIESAHRNGDQWIKDIASGKEEKRKQEDELAYDREKPKRDDRFVGNRSPKEGIDVNKTPEAKGCLCQSVTDDR